VLLRCDRAARLLVCHKCFRKYKYVVGCLRSALKCSTFHNFSFLSPRVNESTKLTLALPLSSPSLSNPLCHKSKMVTRNFRQILGGRVENCGKISVCGFWASKFSQNFREIFDHRKFRHKSFQEVKILLWSADRTPTDTSPA
jgi:hypothetical protein